ncbi:MULTISPECIES: hypothetical protein [Pseudomonadaceae]|uniref:hypothetical protein n=1 Tax=Pseudomonadaceae TaxID=135621 RepID=UPI000F7A2EDF|nr:MULTISPECIES: hypothetical protein [Pseudomonadaceae]RRW13277.1 hypothetical protein EGJ45_18085 [Stutzerimonas stutzeri]RRW22877.1 hypothetical protein EGJ36_18140 [Stutzerimonas stutzeri]RTW55095.1 hypothetical protein DZA06_08865 [Pseudomonas aeruginosa]
MANPRSLVFALYSHWPVVEWLVQRTREIPAFESEQVLALISKVDPSMQRDARENVLRALINTEILRVLPRDELLQLNPLVLEFVRGLNREHELGLSAVLQARVQGIRDATERLNEAIEGNDLDLLRQSAVQLIELFRQIAQQLDQDRHAILEIAEKAKSTEAHVPAERRYRQVLQAYDDYIEPMAEMMDSGPSGSFYRLLEDAERQIDYCQEKLAVQGALYTLRMLVRQAGFQVKELRRLGREVLKQCSDTLLPLREELRRHNSLSAAVSQLLGQVRKRGLSRTFRQPDFPVWRAERPRRVTVGDEVLTIMAEALAYEPVSQAFPDEAPAESATELQFVDGVELRERLAASGPVPSLLDWIRTNYAYLDDATVLRLYHELVREPEWEFQQDDQKLSTDLNRLRVTHYPHGIPAR